jgi:putative protease
MSEIRKIELLSPARDAEIGIAAVNHGADAVYIGAPKFGARKQAGNDLQSLEKLIKYAHFYRSKVYIALNTILFDRELEEAQKLIHNIYEIGADALIFQDTGILEMDLPPIELHASTQTHNFSSEKFRFWEKIGISRVVAARELSIEEIAEIRKQTKIELEYFVHGALCVSLSGQCYLSRTIGARSANRGECAQACRMKYSLKDADGTQILTDKHLLSLKDLNNSDNLKQLIEAGVDSFKIEGRMKDISYVKNITSYYRKKIDLLIEKGICGKSSSGKIYPVFEADPEKSFNRKFTKYFAEKRSSETANFNSPKSLGKFIGTVRKIEKNAAEIETCEIIRNGDGLCFISKTDELRGFRVNTAEENKIWVDNPEILELNARVFRNLDTDFIKQIEKSENIRKINVDFFLKEQERGVSLSATDEDKIFAEHLFEFEKQKAENQEKNQNNILKQLNKAGNTAFIIQSIEIQPQFEVFLPISKINEIRRNVLQLLGRGRSESYQRTEIVFQKTDFPYFKMNLDYRANVSNSLARRFYERHGVESIDDAFELNSDSVDKNLMTTRWCLKFETGNCPVYQKSTAKKLAEPLFLTNEYGNFELKFDCRNCFMILKKKEMGDSYFTVL